MCILRWRFDTYTLIQGVDQFLPVDVYIPGCPPRPEDLIDAVMQVQRQIQKGELPKGVEVA